MSNALPLERRDRLLAMIGAAVWDLDGLSLLWGREAYWTWHHVLGHNLLAGVVVSAIIALAASRRLMMFGFTLALFHLHLVMDYFGSGPGWGISYPWPFSDWQWRNHAAWAFDSWQNKSAAGVLLIFTLLLARIFGRTPLELLAPNVDRRLVLALRGKPAVDKMAEQAMK